jgi:hypothetical protein
LCIAGREQAGTIVTSGTRLLIAALAKLGKALATAWEARLKS